MGFKVAAEQWPPAEAGRQFGGVRAEQAYLSIGGEIVDKLNTEINAALADLKMNARLAEWGATALPGSPADFGKLIAEETEKWGKVVKFAGVKAD